MGFAERLSPWRRKLPARSSLSRDSLCSGLRKGVSVWLYLVSRRLLTAGGALPETLLLAALLPRKRDRGVGQGATAGTEALLWGWGCFQPIPLDPWMQTESFSLLLHRIFGFVAKSQTDSQNLCHLFAEYDSVQPAAPVIDLLCKLLPGP